MSCRKKSHRATDSLEVNLTDLDETGRLHYFYHSPSSDLPIRDVLGEQGKGRKTEPYLERNAENYCRRCWPRNIEAFLRSSEKYLFLFTRCARKESKRKDRRYIVGYIRKERCIDRGGFWAVAGKTKVYSFEDAFQLRKLSYATNARHVRRVLTKKQTARVLDSFTGKPDILAACLRELSGLKEKLRRRERECR
jgi:hypothetical protein